MVAAASPGCELGIEVGHPTVGRGGDHQRQRDGRVSARHRLLIFRPFAQRFTRPEVGQMRDRMRFGELIA